MAKQQVAVREQQEIATLEDTGAFAAFASDGFNNVGKDDLAIPFLAILQSGSPQVKRSEGEYIDGAAEGMLFNTVTKEVIDPAKRDVLVVPCAYDRNFVEWRTREAGGGFVKSHAATAGERLSQDTMRDEKGRDILPNGNQLNDTRSFYVMVLDTDGVPQPAFITMTSTQIKKARQWLTQQNLLTLKGPAGIYRPPMYASKWRVTTVPESNEKGSWMGWAFEHAGYLAGPFDPVFVAAKELNGQIAAGTVKADMAKMAETTTTEVVDEEIPF